jgi:DNA-binding transcriptional ArsR family regulator
MQVFACIYCSAIEARVTRRRQARIAAADPDAVFQALADPSRRRLLDRLHARNGQTLGELCEPMEMARQSVTQHLGILEDANLITVKWQGREKRHYLNVVPLQEIYDRWIRKFERPRLAALRRLKADVEGRTR